MHLPGTFCQTLLNLTHSLTCRVLHKLIISQLTEKLAQTYSVALRSVPQYLLL